MLQWYLQDKGVLNTKVINLRKILIYSAFIIPALLLVLTLAGILKKTSGIEERIISEFRANNEQIEIIRQNLVKMSSDLNQTRNLVGLPESEYSFESRSDTDSDKNSSRPDTDNTLYFLGFEYLKNHYNETELYRTMSELAVNSLFVNTAEKNSIFIQENDSIYNLNDSATGETLFLLKADISDNAVTLESVFSSIEKVMLSADAAVKASEYLDKNAAKARGLDKKLKENIISIKNLAADSIVKGGLREKRLYLDNFTSGIEKTSVNIKRESGVSVAVIALDHSDLSFSFCGNNYKDFTTLRNDLMNISSICDIRTPDERRIEKSRKNLDILAEDSSFTAYLTDNGFSLSGSAREDNDYIYYDITSSSTGLKIGSFAVHKVSGEIYLTDHEEVPLSSINMFSNTSKKKN